MGLFKKGKTKKAIYEYNMLEIVHCDLDSAIKNKHPESGNYCRLIAETSDYWFYSYEANSDDSGGYVLRRSKSNLSEIVFFGDNKQLSCIYNDCLFQTNHSGERGRFFIHTKNIATGQTIDYNWLGKGNVWIWLNGYGRCYCQDSIDKMFVEGDKLVFNANRKKSIPSPTGDDPASDSKYNYDTAYRLVVTYENYEYKPVAYFPPKEENNRSKSLKDSEELKKSQNELGRDEIKHISCKYEGHENDCPNDCVKCAIAIKTDGDIALAENRLDEAIKQYKKAVFVEPKFAEAWVNLGNAYGMKSEYNNAISAFNKAIAIDSKYGKALFGKAVTLRNLGKVDEAMTLANSILEMYNDPNVSAFEAELVSAGVQDNRRVITRENAIAALRNEAYEVMEGNSLLDDNGQITTIKPEEFTKSVLAYCKRKYASLGDKKIHGECIITSFYGSICATIFFMRDEEGICSMPAFDYLNNHIDVEFTDVNAERILGIKAGEEKAEKIWSLISPYVGFAQTVFDNVEKLTDDILLEGMKHAYTIGMAVAIYYTSGKSKMHSLGTRAEIDKALEKLSTSSNDYENPPPVSAMCYSLKSHDETNLAFKCDKCGKAASISVWKYKGNEKEIFSKYRALAGEFCKLGHKASVMFICDECAAHYFPSYNSWEKHNIVFSFIAKGSSTPVYSFPDTIEYRDFKYQVSIKFLNGSETIEQLSADTDTKLNADVYIKHVKEVIGATAK